MINKIPVLKWTLILLVSLSSSTAMAAQRKFIYKVDGNEIILRTCLSGKISNKNECIGPSSKNHIAEYYFKQTLLSPYLLIDSDKLKPLSESDKKAYKASGINPSEIVKKRESNLKNKLKLITQYLKQNSNQKNALTIINKAKEQLISSDPLANHILNLNKLILTTYKNKINSSKKTSIIESATPESRIFWRQFDASIRDCGIEKNMTIKQRIVSCATQIKTPKKGKESVLWKLVARKRSDHNGKFYEVWKDSQTGLLWGDLFDKLMPHFYLVDLDKNGKVNKDKICSSDEYSIARVGISQQTFTLPTISELEQAIENGIREIVPNMNNWYWSSTSFPNEYNDIAWGISNGQSQFRDFDFKYYYSSVRCVSRSK